MEQEITAPQENTSTDIDALYDQAMGESSSTVIPESAPPAPEKYVIKANGKDIEATKEQLLEWATRGYSSPNKIGELNKKLLEWENKWKTHEPILNTYKPVDEFAKQNPQWWQHVMDQWEKRTAWQNPNQTQTGQAPGALPPEFVQEFSQLKEELQSLRQFKDEISNNQRQYQTQMEDQALDTEIKSIREQYPDLDFNSLDENGDSLERRILKHAADIGTKSFKAAFRDYYHDELVKRAQEKGKEAVVNERVKRSKLGLLGETSAPIKGVRSTNVKGKSYENLLQEAMDEAGIRN